MHEKLIKIWREAFNRKIKEEDIFKVNEVGELEGKMMKWKVTYMKRARIECAGFGCCYGKGLK
jgi:hypothetical protein